MQRSNSNNSTGVYVVHVHKGETFPDLNLEIPIQRGCLQQLPKWESRAPCEYVHVLQYKQIVSDKQLFMSKVKFEKGMIMIIIKNIQNALNI